MLFASASLKTLTIRERIAVEKSRLHIPIIFGLDVIHGFRTEFPIPLGLASTWNPALVEQAARIAAREASATGVDAVIEYRFLRSDGTVAWVEA